MYTCSLLLVQNTGAIKVPSIWGLNPDATVKLGLSLYGFLGHFEGEMMQDTGESVLGGLIKFEDGVKQEDLRIQWQFPSKVSGIVRSAIGKVPRFLDC